MLENKKITDNDSHNIMASYQDEKFWTIVIAVAEVGGDATVLQLRVVALGEGVHR
jgi:hypothetical protein